MTKPDVRFPAASFDHSHSATYQFSTCPELQFLTYIYYGKTFGDVDSSEAPPVTSGGVGAPGSTWKICPAGSIYG